VAAAPSSWRARVCRSEARTGLLTAPGLERTREIEIMAEAAWPRMSEPAGGEQGKQGTMRNRAGDVVHGGSEKSL
jgi:hypothetical protein